MAGEQHNNKSDNKLETFFQAYLLLIVVFITGAAVLVLEVAATRILSPYFGNTIFTVSSVISVILFALSIGYALGGRLADKRGSELLFYQIILLSGFSVLLLQVLKLFVLPGLSTFVSFREGPLVTSLLLFTLPGVLLGMLSPFAVKLQQARNKVGIGQTAGDVFFWSTVGSILGSLTTGFYLIPTFGVNEIITGVAVVLVGIGVLGSTITANATHADKKFALLFLAVFTCCSVFLYAIKEPVAATTVFASDGVYDSITIYDGIINGEPTRFLRQATDASSAMNLRSDELVYDYTKYYAVYKMINPDIKTALVIGGGAYSVPKALYHDDYDVNIDVAEIEPDLYTLGKQYFRVPNDNRLQNHVEDGRRFLAQSKESYNLIFVDAFHTSIPSHLTTQEFFTLSKQRLANDGIFVMNIIGDLQETKQSFLLSELKTFLAVYPNNYIFAVNSPESDSAQNIILVGINGEQQLSFSSKDPFLASLPKHRVSLQKYDLTPHPMFTDNYAPVDYLLGLAQ